ncbi:MAG: DNA methyltransferase, partial [Acidimicrobiales bacterium]
MDKKKAAATFETPPGIEARAALLLAAQKDDSIAAELAPLGAALRLDERDQPVVFDTGARYIGPSTRRVATGTHYTPRSLAEDVVVNTLEPLVYRPGPLDTADRSTWRLRPSPDILALRVADIAMGSGAFLVAACRYLAEKLLEAWAAEGRADAVKAAISRATSSDAEGEPVLLEARRQVTDHCLYGVDINPLAVEMAKLSLWLVTMDRQRPFGFLDDRFRCGDSLLGLASVAQLDAAHMEPEGRRSTDIADYIRPLLEDAADIRRRITAHDVVSIRDVEHKARLLADAERSTAQLVTA